MQTIITITIAIITTLSQMATERGAPQQMWPEIIIILKEQATHAKANQEIVETGDHQITITNSSRSTIGARKSNITRVEVDRRAIEEKMVTILTGVKVWMVHRMMQMIADVDPPRKVITVRQEISNVIIAREAEAIAEKVVAIHSLKINSHPRRDNVAVDTYLQVKLVGNEPDQERIDAARKTETHSHAIKTKRAATNSGTPKMAAGIVDEIVTEIMTNIAVVEAETLTTTMINVIRIATEEVSPTKVAQAEVRVEAVTTVTEITIARRAVVNGVTNEVVAVTFHIQKQAAAFYDL